MAEVTMDPMVCDVLAGDGDPGTPGVYYARAIYNQGADTGTRRDAMWYWADPDSTDLEWYVGIRVKVSQATWDNLLLGKANNEQVNLLYLTSPTNSDGLVLGDEFYDPLFRAFYGVSADINLQAYTDLGGWVTWATSPGVATTPPTSGYWVQDNVWHNLEIHCKLTPGDADHCLIEVTIKAEGDTILTYSYNRDGYSGETYGDEFKRLGMVYLGASANILFDDYGMDPAGMAFDVSSIIVARDDWPLTGTATDIVMQEDFTDGTIDGFSGSYADHGYDVDTHLIFIEETPPIPATPGTGMAPMVCATDVVMAPMVCDGPPVPPPGDQFARAIWDLSGPMWKETYWYQYFAGVTEVFAGMEVRVPAGNADAYDKIGAWNVGPGAELIQQVLRIGAPASVEPDPQNYSFFTLFGGADLSTIDGAGPAWCSDYGNYGIPENAPYDEWHEVEFHLVVSEPVPATLHLEWEVRVDGVTVDTGGNTFGGFGSGIELGLVYIGAMANITPTDAVTAGVTTGFSQDFRSVRVATDDWPYSGSGTALVVDEDFTDGTVDDLTPICEAPNGGPGSNSPALIATHNLILSE